MKIRGIIDEDLELLADWTCADPDHKALPADWIVSEPGKAESMMILDEKGPILGFRISKTLRVDIQFAPNEQTRTAKAIISGFSWLMERAKKAGFREVIFTSQSKPLIRFCQRRLGFREMPNEVGTFI